jgi:hypothetical protein
LFRPAEMHLKEVGNVDFLFELIILFTKAGW